MKKALSIIIFLIIGIVILINMNFQLKKENIYGKYVNMNFNNPHCCVEAPHKPDTLTLFRDGTYESKFYGKGDYKYEDGKLDLNYDFENGKAEYKTIITNKLFQKPRIILNEKLNHFYEKLNE